MRTLFEDNPIILAPMAGILDLPLRLTFRKFGWDMTCIGSIDADAVVAGKDGKLINIVGKEEQTSSHDRPVVIQLMGNNTDVMIEATHILEERADVFDINLGCPLKIATCKGWGVSLLQRPEKAIAMVKELTRATAKPFTAKIRILPQDNDNKILSFAKGLEEAGVSALIVHARTPLQGFSGEVDWNRVRLIKEELTIPVLGNGGIRSVQDILSCKESTGCDGVMIGCGAMENPFLARDFSRYVENGAVASTNNFAYLLKFVNEYALLSCALNGLSLRRYYCRRLLHFFILRRKINVFVRRHSG